MKSEFSWSEYGMLLRSRPTMSQSEYGRELILIDRKIEFFVAHLAQARLERRMATLGFNSAPVKCDVSYVETMYVAAIVDARRERDTLIGRMNYSD